MVLSALHPLSSLGPPSRHTLSVTQAPRIQLPSQLRHVEGSSTVIYTSRSQSQRSKHIWNARVHVATTASYSLVEFSPDDFSVERLVGTYGVMNLSSITPGQSSTPNMDENRAAGYDISDLNRMAGLEVGQSMIETRLYKGRIVTAGPRLGTRVLLKAYPSRFTGGAEADAMAANELATHAVLQEDMDERNGGANIALLLGGFQTEVGEQWLVLRDDGLITAARYAQLGSEATGAGRAVGEQEFWDRFDPDLPLERRRRFVVKLLRGVLGGLAYMHGKGRLHQSLGPASVVLNLTEERDVKFLQPRLRDFAFAVDVSDEAILRGQSDGPGSELAEGLWRRATSAGAKMALDRKAFAIADDIYAAGLLVAYLVFVPLCPPGTIDGPTLQRLLETTFRLDLRAAREYCAADERWTQAVRFLDAGDGAGWQLLQDMLNPNFRLRPTADAVLKYPFLTGAAAPVMQ